MKSSFFQLPSSLNCNGTLIDISTPRIMGIVNITPDSFYAKSRTAEADFVEQVQTHLEAGASIIDIGAISTRPKANLYDTETEKNRLKTILSLVKKHFPKICFSLDTFRADVARWAVEDYGIAMINDVSAGDLDEMMFRTVADLQVPYCMMHMQGTPETMQDNPQYDDVTQEIIEYFAPKVMQLQRLGVNDILLDPGFGFGKTLNHNYELLSHLSDFRLFELPLLVGVSRKSMVFRLLDTTPEEALNGTTAVHVLALLGGASVLRVHDVKEAREAIRIVQKYKEFD